MQGFLMFVCFSHDVISQLVTSVFFWLMCHLTYQQLPPLVDYVKLQLNQLLSCRSFILYDFA